MDTLLGALDPATCLYEPPTPDPDREAVKQSRRAALRQLQLVALDPAIPANQKLMCGGCQAFIPPGDAFAIYLDHRMLLALVNCNACREAEPAKDWLYLKVREVGA